MKKFALSIALLLVLSFSALAEGEIPVGGRNCPTPQPCLMAQPAESPKPTDDVPVYVKVIDYLRSLFS